MLIGHFVGCVIAASLCIAPSNPPPTVASLDPYHRTIDVYTTHVVYSRDHIWGLYVDDETPGGLPVECRTAASDRRRGWHRVVVAINMGTPRARCHDRSAINALEWYPFGALGGYVAPPPAPSYILQWGFHWLGAKPPTRMQRRRLLRGAERRHPRLILLYSGH